MIRREIPGKVRSFVFNNIVPSWGYYLSGGAIKNGRRNRWGLSGLWKEDRIEGTLRMCEVCFSCDLVAVGLTGEATAQRWKFRPRAETPISNPWYISVKEWFQSSRERPETKEHFRQLDGLIYRLSMRHWVVWHWLVLEVIWGGCSFWGAPGQNLCGDPQWCTSPMLAFACQVPPSCYQDSSNFLWSVLFSFQMAIGPAKL